MDGTLVNGHSFSTQSPSILVACSRSGIEHNGYIGPRPPGNLSDSEPGPSACARYGALVVGTGPTGSVLAYRLARAGLNVGVFSHRSTRAGPANRNVSRIARRAAAEAGDHGRRVGPADGLFDLRVFDDLMVLTCGCAALGGTSLINVGLGGARRERDGRPALADGDQGCRSGHMISTAWGPWWAPRRCPMGAGSLKWRAPLEGHGRGRGGWRSGPAGAPQRGF